MWTAPPGYTNVCTQSSAREKGLSHPALHAWNTTWIKRIIADHDIHGVFMMQDTCWQKLSGSSLLMCCMQCKERSSQSKCKRLCKVFLHAEVCHLLTRTPHLEKASYAYGLGFVTSPWHNLVCRNTCTREKWVQPNSIDWLIYLQTHIDLFDNYSSACQAIKVEDTSTCMYMIGILLINLWSIWLNIFRALPAKQICLNSLANWFFITRILLLM